MFRKLCIFTLILCLLCALAGCNEGEPKEGSSMEVSFVLEVSKEGSKEESKLPDGPYEVSEESSDLPDGELYHRNPYNPYDRTPVVVHPNFPALSLFTDGTAERYKHSRPYTEYLLVTEITEEGFYGTFPESHTANVFVFGSYEGISRGDYVELKNHDYFLFIDANNRFSVFPAETVKDLRILEEEELEDIFGLEVPEKPVVYLYPEEETVISVKLDYKGDLTCTYPAYEDGKGWEDLTVSPDGTIRKDGKEYYCLYWEGRGIADYDFSKGFCVKGEDSAVFLEAVLPQMGLTPREVEGEVLHRSGLSLLAGPWLWVLLGGSAPDVQTAFLLASLCRSPISPPARFGPMGREVTWEERTLPRPPGPLKAWAHVLLPRRRRAARDPWVGS